MSARRRRGRLRTPSAQDDRRSRMVRQALQLCRLLVAEPLTLAQIGARLGVDQRTARRYIYALQRAGVDVSIAGVNEETDEREASEPVAFRYRLGSPRRRTTAARRRSRARARRNAAISASIRTTSSADRTHENAYSG